MPRDTVEVKAASKLNRYIARLEGERSAVREQLEEAQAQATEPPPSVFDEDAARAELAQCAARDAATGMWTETEVAARHAAERSAAHAAADAHRERVEAAQADVRRLQAEVAELDARIAEARQLLDEEIRAAGREKVLAAEQRMRDATEALIAAMTDVMAARMLAAEGDARKQMQFAGYFASLPELNVYGREGRPELRDGVPPCTRVWGDVRVLPVDSGPVVAARYRAMKAELLGEPN